MRYLNIQFHLKNDWIYFSVNYKKDKRFTYKEIIKEFLMFNLKKKMYEFDIVVKSLNMLVDHKNNI